MPPPRGDGDGAIDCDDGDCGPFCAGAQYAAPMTELCDDGLDNDGDRAVDCYDGDCPYVPDCVR